MNNPYPRTPNQRPIFDKVRKSRAPETGNATFAKRNFLPALSCASILNYFAFRISSCAPKIKLRLSSAIRIVLLFVNRTLTRLMRFAPFSFASFAVVTPSPCIVRRKEPRSPKRTESPSASVSRISYCRAQYRLDGGRRYARTLLNTPDNRAQHHGHARRHLRIKFHLVSLERIFLRSNDKFNHCGIDLIGE